jgi:rifampicin phosphotransferase
MSDVLDFQEIDQTQVGVVGGKGAALGELSRIEGVRVPAGFCVTTDAYQRILADTPAIDDRLDRLSRLKPGDSESIGALSAEIRRTLEGIAIPEDLASAITHALARLSDQVAYAVRSSATVEDLPMASFAGQYDTYLNVIGPAAILQEIRRCWASLFTERAVTYRLRNGFDDRKIGMAVIVQQMVFLQAAGILFTADPVTSNRRIVSVEASLGLGEAVVSGRVNTDVYKVRDGKLIEKVVATKQLAIQASSTGGTEEQTIDPERQSKPALTDAQVLELAQLGRRIEAHFGRPQDIEWCLADDGIWIVQSRPITTLFPIPGAADRENHVYVSVGHGQMMTDAMRPLGVSIWQLTAMVPMHEAGGRLFVDVAPRLASPASRAATLEALGKGDPLIGDALQTVLDRGDFIQALPDDGPATATTTTGRLTVGAPTPIETDPAIVADLIARNAASVAALKRDIQTKSGPELLDFILEDFQELKRLLSEPLNTQAIMAGMQAAWWLNDHLEEWLGEKNAADTLALSVSGNVTAEMGLGLLDVADVIRAHPNLVEFLENVEGESFLDELATLEGGQEARDAIAAYLDKYGVRGVGEIDITRPRWSERPDELMPLILSNVRNFEPGAGERRFEQGLRESREKEHEVLERVRALPDGERKAQEVKRNIDRVRTFAGYREYPKYGIVSRHFVYKQALLEEAERLVLAGVLREAEDIFYLTFQELHELTRTHHADDQLIRRRKNAFRSDQALTPPRVLTSEGEAVAGSYRRDDFPAGALVGLPVSAGTVEGRARVVLDFAHANLEAGDILVTAFTDPSWAALFVTIKGLVTEVGGLMTHGAVIAREYGLPAVVGVERATELIQDGQRIRVNGTDGYVELLS